MPAHAITIDSEWFGGAGIWADEANWLNSPDLGSFPNNGGGLDYNASITVPFSFVISNTNIEVNDVTVGEDATLVVMFSELKAINPATFKNNGTIDIQSAGITSPRIENNAGGKIESNGAFDGGVNATRIVNNGTVGGGTSRLELFGPDGELIISGNGTIDTGASVVSAVANDGTTIPIPGDVTPLVTFTDGTQTVVGNGEFNTTSGLTASGSNVQVTSTGGLDLAGNATSIFKNIQVDGLLKVRSTATTSTQMDTTLSTSGILQIIDSNFTVGGKLQNNGGGVLISTSTLDVTDDITNDGTFTVKVASTINAMNNFGGRGGRFVVVGEGNRINVNGQFGSTELSMIDASGPTDGSLISPEIVINANSMKGAYNVKTFGSGGTDGRNGGFIDIRTTGGLDLESGSSVSSNGADSSSSAGSGGTVRIRSTNGGYKHGGNVGGETLNDVSGGEGGAFGAGNGGIISIDVSTDVSIGDAVNPTGKTIDANGGKGGNANTSAGGNGGNGGMVEISLANDAEILGLAQASGGNGGNASASSNGGDGGNGGSVKVTSSGPGTINIGPIVANSGDGGDGNGANAGGKGGDSGSFVIDAPLGDVILSGVDSVVGRRGDGPLGGDPGQGASIEIVALSLQSVAPINLLGGVITADSADITLEDMVEVVNGRIFLLDLDGTVINKSDVNVTGNSELDVAGRFLNDFGTVRITNSIVTINDLDNSGSTFELTDAEYNFGGFTNRDGGDVSITGGSGGIDILNGSAGTFTFSSTSFTNPGGVTNRAGGGIEINNSNAKGGGLWNNETGATLDITNLSTVNLDAGLENGGEVELSGGSELNVRGGGIFNDGGTLNITGGTGATLGDIDNRNGGGIHISDGSLEGGGLWRSDGSTVTLTGKSIGTAGGGLEILNGGELELNSGSRFDVSGGGIFIDAPSTLTITDSTVTNNVATPEGGGIFNDGGTINITGGSDVSTLGDVENRNGGGIVIDNSLFSAGGFGNDTGAQLMITGSSTFGLFGLIRNSGDIQIRDALLISDRIVNSGGVLLVEEGDIEVNAGNTIPFHRGLENSNGGSIDLDDSRLDVNSGGIFNDSTSTLTITDSTVTNNVARGDGGGIFNDGGNVTITNSNVSTLGDVENRNGGDTRIEDSNVEGGGLWKNETGATLTINDATLKTNTLENRGNMKIDNSTISGNLANRAGGRFAPGRSPGIATVDGDFTNDPGATLDMEIFGLTPIIDFDVLDVTGTATLGGRLNLIFNFTPTLGEQFDILSAGAIVGQFDQVTFSGLASNRQAGVVVGNTGVSIVIEERLAGAGVPEPTTGLLCLITFVAATGHRRRAG